MPTLTEQLIDKVFAVKYEALPVAAIDMAKQVTLDGIAVMLAGATEPLGLGRIVTQYVKDSGGNPQASVIAGGFKTSMLNAAYANGTMAHALDFDNTWYPLNHPTSPTLPAILAIAEHHDLGGRKIIESIVAAFEVQGRMRMAATGLETGSGFHKPGTTGQFGAVTAAAKMLDLDRQQMLMAFGIAGSRAGSISINTGTMTKSSHAGHAARMGVECAVLAKMGFTGSADVFGPKGFFDTFLFGKAEPHLLIENFGAPFRMVDPGVGFKKHPSNYFTHRPIDAALALRERHQIKAEQIAKVEVVFPRFEYINRPQPETGLDGKFSVQYTTAVALLDGEITVDTFNNERRFAADVVALLPKIALRFDDSIPNDFDRMHIDMTVTLADGHVLKQHVDKLSGWIGSPLTREQRLKKFYVCARRVLTASAADEVVTLVENLEQRQMVADLMTLLRGARKVRFLLCCAALIAANSYAADPTQDKYPTKPIRFIMPYPVGGSIDLGGRTAAQQAADNMGQQIVIDNRTGAGGTLGAELGARAAPDGYTIVMGGTGTLAISPGLSRKLGYDVAHDFAPITLLATTPYVLVVPPSLPAKSLKELIAMAKAQPGKVMYASGGSGSAPHLIGEVFRLRAGAEFLHVPYKGSVPAKIDLMAGRVQMLFTGVPSVVSELKAGTLRALGVTSAKRSASLPDVPSIAEAGIVGLAAFDVSPWFGVLAPARVPPAIVARLHAEFVKALHTPQVRDTMLRNGFNSVGNSPQEFTAFIASERKQWSEAIRVSGAKVE